MRKQLFVFAGILAAAIALGAQEATTLRFKLEPGKEIRYASKTETAMQMMGMDLGGITEMTMKLTPAADAKGFKVTMSPSDVKMTLADGNPMAAQMETMKKTLETMKVVTVYSELGAPLESKTEASDPSAAAMASGASDSAGFLGLQYPQKSVRVGDSWKAEFDASKMLGPLGGDKKQILPIEFSFTKLDGGIGTIVAKIVGPLNLEAPTGQEIKVNISTESTYLVDIATGLPNEVTTKANNTLDLGLGEATQTLSQTLKRL